MTEKVTSVAKKTVPVPDQLVTETEKTMGPGQIGYPKTATNGSAVTSSKPFRMIEIQRRIDSPANRDDTETPI